MDARTVTALDAITAFAVPSPSRSSQSDRFFQLWLPRPVAGRADRSAYFGVDSYVRYPALSAVGSSQPRSLGVTCQCRIPGALPKWEITYSLTLMCIVFGASRV